MKPQNFDLQSKLFICFEIRLVQYLSLWEMYIIILWWLEFISSAMRWLFLSSSADCKRHAGNEKQTPEDNQTTGKYKEGKPKQGNYSGAFQLLCHIISQSDTGGLNLLHSHLNIHSATHCIISPEIISICQCSLFYSFVKYGLIFTYVYFILFVYLLYPFPFLIFRLAHLQRFSKLYCYWSFQLNVTFICTINL